MFLGREDGCAGAPGAWGWQRPPRHLTVLGSAPLQVPAPLPGGGQGAAPLAHHRWAPRVGRPDGSALAPRPAHGTGGEGPAHQHRSVPPSPIPLIPWVPPSAPGLSAGLWLPLGGWVSPRHPPYLVPLAPARCWDVAGRPWACITSASGHPAHHWVSARSAPLLWGCPESKVKPCPVLPGSSTFLEGLGTWAEGLGLAAGDGVAPRGDGLLHGGTSFASG